MFLYCDVLQSVKSRNRDSKVGVIKDKIRHAMLANSWYAVGMKTVLSARGWCEKVMIDRRSDQLGEQSVRFDASTIRHRGRATRRVDQYTNRRRFGQEKAKLTSRIDKNRY